MRVYVVMLEYNDPPTEMTEDPGLIDVFDNEPAAQACADAERARLHNEGQAVYDYTTGEDRYCGACGAHTPDPEVFHQCPKDDPDAEEFCTYCGAELKDGGSCDNDHDDWDVDIHIRETEVLSEYTPGEP